MKSYNLAGIFLVLVLLAAGLRFPSLAQRPMHCDEAVQADKFGTLLEKGSYEYSPEEFHGPTLNYLTLLPAWLQGISHYADVSEITLRSVPAFFGVLLVASHFLIAPQLGIRAAITSALLAAVSPAMVFYSRYYIHEAILVFFSFTAILSICRYLKTPHAGWAVNAGVSLGLMHATKETCVIAFASMALAWLFTWIIEKLQDRSQKPQISPQSHSAARDQDSGIRDQGIWPQLKNCIVRQIRKFLFFAEDLKILNLKSKIQNWLWQSGRVASPRLCGSKLINSELHSQGRILIQRRHVLLAILAAMLVSSLLFSSFLSHPSGIADSLLTYRTYIERASSNLWHIHPWYYYFNLLLCSHSQGSPVWTEGLIIGLAVLGFWAGMRGHCISGVDPRILRFLGFYTLAITTIYACIPYKTPWCLLGFLHGMTLLAGVGTVTLMQASQRTAVRVLVCVFLVAATAHLGWQAWAGAYRYPADPRNPYVYAHTGDDVFVIVRQIENLARVHPDGFAMPIQIFTRENLWPLPWYLRRFSHVRWWNGVSDSSAMAPLILATPDMEPALVRKLYELPPPGQRELYMNIFERPVELRPQVEIRGYAAKSLWDEYRQWQATNSSATTPDIR